MDLNEALARLPHGPEFRFIDRLISLNPGQNGVGEYLIRGDEAFLQGHFPGHPLFPGVLLVEAVAQLAGVVTQCDPAIAPLADLRLTAIRAVKIFGSATGGQTLRIEAAIVSRLGGLIHARGSVSVGADKLCLAEATLSGRHGM